MKKSAVILCTLCTFLALGIAGCSNFRGEAEVTPTPIPEPTVTPTPVPATATPVPTVTPAPKLIGKKTETARYITLTNSTGVDIRQIYVCVSGMGDWGNNLIPAESTVKSAQEVNMYYEPMDGALYNIQFTNVEGITYEIYSADLDDMERATLQVENGVAFLRYLSQSSKNEKTTNGTYSAYDTSAASGTTYDSSTGSTSYGDTSYDNTWTGGSTGGTTSGGTTGGTTTGDGSTTGGDTGGGTGGTTGDGTGGTTGDGTGGTTGDGSGTGTGDTGSTGGSGTTGDGSGTGGGGNIVWDEDGNWTEY